MAEAPVHDADEQELESARALAWRALNRRERSTGELRRQLEGRAVQPEAVVAVLAELTERGYLDDERYARHFAEDRRRLDGWGPERIERRLRELGVGPEEIAAALAGRDPAEELVAARELLQRRSPGPLEGDRERDRALRLLVRRGYGLELAHDAIRAHLAASRHPGPSP